ncbi:hypothetical protein L1Q15_20405, partial [Klebsiella pneumoniae]
VVPDILWFGCVVSLGRKLVFVTVIPGEKITVHGSERSNSIALVRVTLASKMMLLDSSKAACTASWSDSP